MDFSDGRVNKMKNIFYGFGAQPSPLLQSPPMKRAHSTHSHQFYVLIRSRVLKRCAQVETLSWLL